MSLFTRAVLAVTESGPVEEIVTGTRAGRTLAGRFVAGNTLDSATEAATQLNRSGLDVSLDLLGEEVADREGADQAAGAYVACLDQISAEGLEANVSVKLTQLGLSISQDMAVAAVDRLAVEAERVGTTVTIDMEDSRFTDDTVEIYADAQTRHGNLGLCLQAYLRRTPADLERLVSLGGHIRLCKGAYVESSNLAFQGADEVDAAFGRLLMVLMEAEETRPAIATHDPALIEFARRLGERRTGGFEYQMLYGVRRDEQRRLAGDGHDVRIYLPFGSAWYPYLTRRLAERPANAWFFLRALAGRR